MNMNSTTGLNLRKIMKLCKKDIVDIIDQQDLQCMRYQSIPSERLYVFCFI